MRRIVTDLLKVQWTRASHYLRDGSPGKQQITGSKGTATSGNGFGLPKLDIFPWKSKNHFQNSQVKKKQFDWNRVILHNFPYFDYLPPLPSFSVRLGDVNVEIRNSLTQKPGSMDGVRRRAEKLQEAPRELHAIKANILKANIQYTKLTWHYTDVWDRIVPDFLLI